MILLEFFLPNLYLFQTVSVKYMTKKYESEMNFSSLRFSHLHVYMIELDISSHTHLATSAQSPQSAALWPAGPTLFSPNSPFFT